MWSWHPGAANAVERIVTAMIDYELRERSAVITIRRPEARNAVNAEIAIGMEKAIDRLEEDPDVLVGVVTGEGPVFSAGADLKAVADGRVCTLVFSKGPMFGTWCCITSGPEEYGRQKMEAEVGDRLILEGERLGQARRVGEVMAIHGTASRPYLRIRWDDGHESLFVPGAGAKVEHRSTKEG